MRPLPHVCAARHDHTNKNQIFLCSEGTHRYSVWINNFQSFSSRGRSFNGNSFKGKLLTLLPLTGQTSRQQICLTLMNFFFFWIVLGELVSVTTDGAPSTVGREKGLISLHFFSYHCIIHQEQLCCIIVLSGELKTMKAKVVKAVNYIRSHALEHRQFRTFLLRKMRRNIKTFHCMLKFTGWAEALHWRGLWTCCRWFKSSLHRRSKLICITSVMTNSH